MCMVSYISPVSPVVDVLALAHTSCLRASPSAPRTRLASHLVLVRPSFPSPVVSLAHDISSRPSSVPVCQIKYPVPLRHNSRPPMSRPPHSPLYDTAPINPSPNYLTRALSSALSAWHAARSSPGPALGHPGFDRLSSPKTTAHQDN
jgi:hypothetical protein